MELPSNASSPFKNQKHPSILKNYKSCPVSPVHEEIDWMRVNSAGDSTANAESNNNSPHKHKNKRHSMYSDDAKTILDKIHADTEQMIAEITQKYGDLNEVSAPPRVPSVKVASSAFHSTNPFHPKNMSEAQQVEDGGNFSSDSLEDCSLDLSAANSTRKCQKKHRKNDHGPQQNTFPKRSQSEYFICDDYGLNSNRNVSLSDILNDDDGKAKKNFAFMNSQRHSSASFFLGPERRSQESLLSDELSGCGVSYCNSMESILSDESECKSAPLEVLFERSKREFYKYPGNSYDTGRPDANCSSKSYGSSPNNVPSGGFDYYMEHHQQTYAGYTNDSYNTSSYGCYDSFVSNARNAGRCAPAPLPPPPQFQNKSHVSYSKPIPSSCTFPSISEHCSPRNEEIIPRLGPKNTQYTSQTNRSLSKEFACLRQQNNSNPLYGLEIDDNEMFQKKSVMGNESPTQPELKPHIPIRKSCSFEIELFHNRGKALQQKSAAKKYEQNLEKFEKDRNRGRASSQLGGTLEMSYVPHKPPVANRRTSSVKTKRGLREKDRYHTVGQIKCSEPNSKHSKLEGKSNDGKEKSIEVYIAETNSVDDDNMDSLELYSKPKLYKENSVDSLDDLGPTKQTALKKPSTISAAVNPQEKSMVTEDFLSQAEYLKFRDIENKIDVINRLVEMEEKKLEQERVAKELRMRPFKANAQKKGYVKSLTMNFDNLAKTMQYERDLGEKSCPMTNIKRNYSLPDVLEVAKYQFLYDGDFDSDIRSRIKTFLEKAEGAEAGDHSQGARGGQSNQYLMMHVAWSYLVLIFGLIYLLYCELYG